MHILSTIFSKASPSMRREVLSIYGPFSIQSYGLAIVLGIGLFSFLFLRDSRTKALITRDQYSTLLLVAVCAGAVGGRLLALLTGYEPFSLQELIFDGGLSVLGSVITVISALAITCWRLNIPIKPTLDMAALYAPLLQSIARLGCLAAGCCHGAATHAAWAITYTDPKSLAPLHIPLHPTQLYSAALLVVIFCILWQARSRLLSTSRMLEAYLISISIERLLVDFLRADREWIRHIPIVSTYQLICCAIIVATVAWLHVSKTRNTMEALK